MTSAWHLAVDSPRRELAPEAVVQRARQLRPELNSTARLVCRRAGTLRFYEPYVDGGALAAVYAAKKSRRNDLRNDVGSLAMALLESGGRVSFCRQSEDLPLLAALPPKMDRRTLDQILELVRSGTYGCWEVDLGLLRFQFAGVEVRLGSPLEIDGGGQAGGFFAKYEVTATSVAEAVEILRAVVGEEGGWFVDVPAPRLLGVARDRTDCCRVGGRAFFPSC